MQFFNWVPIFKRFMEGELWFTREGKLGVHYGVHYGFFMIILFLFLIILIIFILLLWFIMR